MPLLKFKLITEDFSGQHVGTVSGQCYATGAAPEDRLGSYYQLGRWKKFFTRERELQQVKLAKMLRVRKNSREVVGVRRGNQERLSACDLWNQVLK